MLNTYKIYISKLSRKNRSNVVRVTCTVLICLLFLLLLQLYNISSVDLSTWGDLPNAGKNNNDKTGSSDASSSEAVETVEPLRNFDFVINFVNVHHPNVSKPTSSNFVEKDIARQHKSNQLGNYANRGANINSANVKKDWSKLSYRHLMEKYLIVNENIKYSIKEKHVEVIENINNYFPYPSENFYNGAGVVLVGGGKHSPMVYSIIKIMRLLGTTLPVEVLIPDHDTERADTNFCRMIEEENSKCIYLDQHFDSLLLNQSKFSSFQYKSLALLVSSFQHVLMIDADNYPLIKLDDIFDHPAYNSTGMVVWPDMWRRSTHPFFYESANVTIDFEKRIRNYYDSFTEQKSVIPEEADVLSDVPYHDFEGTMPDPASETGQFMIDKKKHWKSLILSFYYNTFGPNLYYHLLSQYSAGQGDKETFLAAAHVLKLPYYQVLSSTTLDGFFRQNGKGFKTTGYYQKDFRSDYEIKKKLLDMPNLLVKENLESFPFPLKNIYFSSKSTEASAMFAHLNYPKFNPLELAYHNEYVWEGSHFRGLTHKECLLYIDLEKEVIDIYNELFCLNEEQPMKQLVDEERLVTQEELCDYYKKKAAFLKTNKLL